MNPTPGTTAIETPLPNKENGDGDTRASSLLTPLTPNGEPPAIAVSGLTKRFQQRHRGSLKRAILGAMKPPSVENFTALDGISFQVPHGQTLAVIGSNGSGKSTLLSILARVYRPTEGQVLLRSRSGGPARIAPLLALDAGFHPDLTGLENIEFYGAVLGLRAHEVDAKTDQIIRFAGLEAKIDTTVRGWNDGARLRLGFAIAVHIDPDILLVDEVLAVGDETFQNKCYALIADMQREGKTIVFVSHDLPVVERVANRILWLKNGVITMDGDVPTVMRAYRAASV